MSLTMPTTEVSCDSEEGCSHTLLVEAVYVSAAESFLDVSIPTVNRLAQQQGWIVDGDDHYCCDECKGE